MMIVTRPGDDARSSAAGAEVRSWFPVPEEELSSLHERLEIAAGDAGLLDVAYRTVESPLGGLLLAATPRGLVRVAFACENLDTVLQTLADRLSPRVLHAPARLDAAARELEEYFDGRRRTFDLALDHCLSTGFRRTVQQALPGIGYGHTATYREIAERVGNPRAYRAVGSACTTNPLPIVLPCHRVLRSDGTLGGYLGGLPAKTTLLTLENSAPPSHR